MRTLALTLLILITSLMAHSKDIKPDFAYPQTVSKTAEADLKKAVKDGDAAAALVALIQYTIAENLVDPSRIQQCLTLTQETAETFSTSPLNGLYQAYMARLYNDVYNANRWIYDDRQLPLTPRSQDITEWSGDQYQAAINEYLEKAMAQESINQLKVISILKYPQLIDCTQEAALYYSTLADFVYHVAASMSQEEKKELPVYDRAIETAAGNAGPTILWKTLKAQYDENSFEALRNLYDEYAQTDLSGYTLQKMTNDIRTFDQRRVFATLAREYLNRYPKAMLASEIKYRLDVYLNPSLRTNYASLSAVGYPLKVEVNNQNTQNYVVEVYRVEDAYVAEVSDRRTLKNKIARLKPVQTIPVKTLETSPFMADTTLYVTLDRQGYYVIVAREPNGSLTDSYLSCTRCLPIVPIAVNDAVNQSLVLTVNPYTGQPIADASVKITDKKSTLYQGKTDKSGIAVSDMDTRDRWSQTLKVATGGEEYSFRDVNVHIDTESGPDIQYNAKVFSDRGIYHPGETADVLGIFTVRHQNPGQKFISDPAVGITVSFVLMDANWQPIDTLSTTTDEYGRAVARFTLPTDGLTGTFTVRALVEGTEALKDNIRTILSNETLEEEDVEEPYNESVGEVGNCRFMVSDYRMPEFKVEIEAIACDTPTKGEVTVKGNLMTYSGMPVSGATVTLTLKKSENWWRNANGTPCYSVELQTDEDGNFTTVIPKGVFAENPAVYYTVEIDAVSMTGSSNSTSRSFALTQKYFISLSLDSLNIDGSRPLSPNVKVTDPDGQSVEIPLVWQLLKDNEAVASGTYYGIIDISNIKPGSYVLEIKAQDSETANTATCPLVIYNVASGIVPDSMPLWRLYDSISADQNGHASVLIATGNEKTYLYSVLNVDNNIVKYDLTTYDYGYHNIQIDMPGDSTEGTLTLICQIGCQTYSETITIRNTVNNKLQIVGESFRDRLLPGTSETWRFKICQADGSPIQAALALDMYNAALDELYPQRFSIHFNRYGGIMNRLDIDSPSAYNVSNSYSPEIKTRYKSVNLRPELNTYGYPLYTRYGRDIVMYSAARVSPMMDECKKEVMVDYDADGAVEQVMVRGLNSLSASKMAGSAMVEEAVDDSADNGQPEPQAETEISYRDSYVPLAVWAPILTTDGVGNLEYTFTVPDANTTWRLQAIAWTQALEYGNLMRDFVASKPVMVQPNLPRFLRSGDSATVLSAVMNNSDSVAAVTATVEIFDPMTSRVMSSKSYTLEIGPKQTASVGIDIHADGDMAAIGYRIKATNGQFGDGEQSVIPVLTSDASLIETTPFYLNPGETTYATRLPKEKDARLTLTFCENPAWTIVSALPGLRTQINEYANSAAAALYSAAVSRGMIKENPALGDALRLWAETPTDSALVSMLQQNESLKVALLNATPWVQAAQADTQRMANLAMIFDNKEVDGSINAAMEILKKLQNDDGGWSWGKWCDESSIWVTGNVLSMLGDLYSLGWLPEDKSLTPMITKAVKYFDREVEKTDLLYTLTRPLFKDIEVSANGRKVIKATLDWIRKDWKKATDPAYKSMMAQALFLNGDRKGAELIMGSVSQFGVYTPSQGLRFPSVDALYDYAILLEAYATILPGSREVDGLRQQLIVRKQANSWGDAVVTTEVVKSILTSGSRWTVEAQGAKIKAGDTAIEPEGEIEHLTGSLTADISAYAGKELTITTPGVGPAYGAVYAQFNKAMEDVKASSCDDLDIEKHLYVRRGDRWEEATTLQVGDRVKVQLTIHNKREMQYVSIIDERPASFEPVDQLPGWMWSEGVGFYRENRDATTTMHVVYMRSGTYLLTYEMNVNVAGEFSSGVATIQSQYAPALSAHSSGTHLTVNP